MKGNVDHQVTCLATWQKAGKHYRPEPLEGRRVGCVLESLFLWVSKVEGRRAVLVPDPCLSGAAVFTVRKEAVICVCFHLSKQEQPPPSAQKYRGRQTPGFCTFLKTENKEQERKYTFEFLHLVRIGMSVWVYLGLDPSTPLFRDPQVIDRLSTWGIEFPLGVKSLWLFSKGWLHSWPGHELTTFTTTNATNTPPCTMDTEQPKNRQSSTLASSTRFT